MTEIKYTKKINKNIGIYAIINQVNGKMYVGQSSVLRNRKKQHFSALRDNKHGNAHLQKAFNKYKEPSFKWEVLEYCKKEKLTEREQHYIDKYNVCNSHCGYNEALRADKTIMSEETKKKNMEWHLGHKHTEETKKKMAKGHIKYKHLIEEWGELRQQGLSYREIGRRYNMNSITIKVYLKEYYPSEEFLNKKWKFTNEVKEKISRANKGRKPATQTIEAVKRANKKRRKYTHLINEWIELRKQGLLYREIGKKYGVSESTVNHYLKYYKEEEMIKC